MISKRINSVCLHPLIVVQVNMRTHFLLFLYASKQQAKEVQHKEQRKKQVLYSLLENAGAYRSIAFFRCSLKFEFLAFCGSCFLKIIVGCFNICIVCARRPSLSLF